MISRIIGRLRREMRSSKIRSASSLDPKMVPVTYFDCDNFGDQLTPDIFSHYGYNAVHVPVARYSRVCGVGSILHLLPHGYGGFIFGSGYIDNNDYSSFPNAMVLSVRGALTRDRISKVHKSSTIRLGDPGLLAKRLYSSSVALSKPKYLLGIIPHYRDFSTPCVHAMASSYPDQVSVINVRQSPREVADQISECQNIASSSLHGLIFADSIGIPNCRIVLSDGIIGGDFKFDDYYSVFDRKNVSIAMTQKTSMQQLMDGMETPDTSKVDLVVNEIELVCQELFRSLETPASECTY